jgi:hypothetical protein
MCSTTLVSCLWVTDIYRAMSLNRQLYRCFQTFSQGFALP